MERNGEVPIAPESGPSETHAAMVRAARLILGRGCWSVGLIGAGEACAVQQVALRLGRGLFEVAGDSVLVVVPGPLASSPGSDADTRAPPGPGAEAQRRRAGPELAARVLEEGPRLHALEAVLCEEATACRRLVVDLTGFDRNGEHLEAIALLDGTAIVALAGRTTTPELERRAREVPAERSLGVLLLDPRGGS